jgi:histidinol-phosphate aminotransferase
LDQSAQTFEPHLDPFVSRMTTRRRSNKRGLLDLSRNELVHPGLEPLLQEALSNVSPLAASRYPVLDGLLGDLAGELRCGVEEIEIFPGSDDAIAVLIDGLTRTNRHFLLQEPNYPGYRRNAELRRVQVRSWLPRPGRLHYDVEDALRGMERVRSSLVVATDPHGMLGTAAEEAALVSLATGASLHGHLLVVDECYQAFSSEHHEALRGRPHVVRVGSFSKAFGLAGLRLGYVIAAPAIIDYLKHWRRAGAVSGVTLHVAAHLIRARAAELQQVRADVVRGREWLAGRIRRLDAEWQPLPSEANFLTVDVGSSDTARLVAQHLARNGVAIRAHDAPAFGSLLQITAAPIPTLQRVAELLQEFVDSRRLLTSEAGHGGEG